MSQLDASFLHIEDHVRHMHIGSAANRMGGGDGGLWDEEAGFYFDRLKLPDGRCFPIAGSLPARDELPGARLPEAAPA